MKKTLNKLGQQYKTLLAARAFSKHEEELLKLEAVKLLTFDEEEIKNINAEIGLCRALYDWFIEILEDKHSENTWKLRQDN